mmetsp:Transcript_18905/g.43410  ORF Transcript_18905/g.43410 Transcript_18905/m.43410 type:complete len:206 (+) Transcript_18905:460-1077(+)
MADRLCTSAATTPTWPSRSATRVCTPANASSSTEGFAAGFPRGAGNAPPGAGGGGTAVGGGAAGGGVGPLPAEPGRCCSPTVCSAVSTFSEWRSKCMWSRSRVVVHLSKSQLLGSCFTLVIPLINSSVLSAPSPPTSRRLKSSLACSSDRSSKANLSAHSTWPQGASADLLGLNELDSRQMGHVLSAVGNTFLARRISCSSSHSF